MKTPKIPRPLLLGLLITSLGHGVAAQVPILGLYSDDCATALDPSAAHDEFYAFKMTDTGDTPDVLFDTRSNGGTNVVADLGTGLYLIAPNWAIGMGASDFAVTVLTSPGHVYLDSGRATDSDLHATSPQVVGTIDGVAPGLVASNYGFELRFHPLVQIAADTVPDCSMAGDPTGGLRPIIGYDVYRVADTGTTPPLSTFRTQGWVGFIDLSKLDFTVADATGFGCSDLAPGDETRLVNPDGLPDTGDEVLIYRDTTRNGVGVARAKAPNPRSRWWYRVQPVVRGSIPYLEGPFGWVSSAHLPVTVSDRDGDGIKESVDLTRDGRYEFVDPSRHGLGLTYGGEIASSPSAGNGVPLSVTTDTDGDGILDADEITAGLDRLVSNATRDGDGDGVKDGLEVELALKPGIADGDGGGERDGRELFYGRSASNPCDDVVVNRPLGDVSGDGTVAINDVQILLRMSVGLTTPTAAQMVVGDIAPADIVNAVPVPDQRRRHGNPDGFGNHPFGRFEHGDGALDIGDAVLDLRQVVGLTTVTD
jgi:hypothetical protein